MKRKLLFAAFLLLAVLLAGGVALAATDPIVCEMTVSPSTLTEPGEVTVSITITNTGDADMQEALTLYNPTSEIVTDFGDEGSATLKAGESVTWSGPWEVNQHTMDNGQIIYFIKYALYDDDGNREVTSQPIRGKLDVTEATTDIEVKRTITPGTASDGQTVTIIYDIANTGTSTLKNVTLQENKDIKSKSINVADEMKAGDAAQVKIPITMGKKDLTSSATVTYTAGGSSEKLTETVEEQTILYGKADMTAKLTSSAKGVAIGETAKLTLELKNSGTMDYINVRVTDKTLGDVFTDQTVPAGETITLEKDVTLTETTEYQFTVTATDTTGVEATINTDSLTVTAVDPDKIIHLTLVAAADRTEVYSRPGTVRFTLTIQNDSEVDAGEVVVYEADTELYTYAAIPAGATRTLTRDASLSMAGKYQFTAVTADALKNEVRFESNEIQIAFSVPTPAPATPTPAAAPTAEPTYAVLTYAPINDPGVGTAPKLIRAFFYPLMIVAGILLILAAVLLLVATKRRMDEKRASEAALDHLDRAKRRDYIAPAEETDETEAPPAEELPNPVPPDAPAPAGDEDAPLDEAELPHMKYVRSAYQRAEAEHEPDTGADYGYSDVPPPIEPEKADEEDAPSAPQERSGNKSSLAEQIQEYRERDTYYHEPLKTRENGFGDEEEAPAVKPEAKSTAGRRRPAARRRRAEEDEQP